MFSFVVSIFSFLQRSQEPLTQEYVLQALVISGIELPSFGTILSQQLRVRVSCGIHEISTRPAKYENGLCRWNEFIMTEKFSLPVDVTQIPDIFVYLIREDLKPVCFTRMKPVTDAKAGILLGFERDTQWYLLQEDKSINALSNEVFPGTVYAFMFVMLCVCCSRHTCCNFPLFLLFCL